jgi:hypothetical protein
MLALTKKKRRIQMNYSYADGNTGYPTREPGGLKYSQHGNTGGHHIDVSSELYAHGNGGGHHREPEGIQGRSVERIYFHHMLGYTMS